MTKKEGDSLPEGFEKRDNDTSWEEYLRFKSNKHEVDRTIYPDLWEFLQKKGGRKHGKLRKKCSRKAWKVSSCGRCHGELVCGTKDDLRSVKRMMMRCTEGITKAQRKVNSMEYVSKFCVLNGRELAEVKIANQKCQESLSRYKQRLQMKIFDTKSLEKKVSSLIRKVRSYHSFYTEEWTRFAQSAKRFREEREKHLRRIDKQGDKITSLRIEALSCRTYVKRLQLELNQTKKKSAGYKNQIRNIRLNVNLEKDARLTVIKKGCAGCTGYKKQVQNLSIALNLEKAARLNEINLLESKNCALAIRYQRLQGKYTRLTNFISEMKVSKEQNEDEVNEDEVNEDEVNEDMEDEVDISGNKISKNGE